MTLVVTPHRKLLCCSSRRHFYTLVRSSDRSTVPSPKPVSTLNYALEHLLSLLLTRYRRVQTLTTCHHITHCNGEMQLTSRSPLDQTGSSQKTKLLMGILMPSVKGTWYYPSARICEVNYSYLDLAKNVNLLTGNLRSRVFSSRRTLSSFPTDGMLNMYPDSVQVINLHT